MPGPSPNEWSIAHGRAQRDLTRNVRKVLQEAFDSINRQMRELEQRPGVGAAVRREQLSTVRTRLRAEINTLTRSLSGVIGNSKLDAGEKAVNLTARIDAVLFDAAGQRGIADALRRSMLEGLQRTTDVALARMEGRSHRPLSQKIYNLSVGLNNRIDRTVNSALARGLNAREFAEEVRGFFQPGTPGGTRYASLRLARTEINNAFHALSIENAIDRPWVPGMKWHLSGSHPEPDECNDLADGGPRGDGVYTPEQIPNKPHPHCFCFVTPEPLSANDFIRQLEAGAFDDFLGRNDASR